MAITIAATTKTIQAKANQEKKAAQGLEAKATMDRGLAATTTVKADRAVAHVTTTAKVARPADLVAQRTMMTLAHPVDQADPAEDDLIGTGTTTTVVEMTGTTTRIVIVTEAIVTEAKAATEAIVTVTIAGTEIVTEATAVTVTTVETMAENGMAVARTTVEADDPTTNATAIARDQVIGTIIAEDVADHPTIADGATAEAEAETRVAIVETTQTEVVTLEAETTTATGTTITKTTTIQPMSMKQN